MTTDVEAWFRLRTWQADDLDPAAVVAAKAGRTVSVVIPALDEETTVGAVVASALAAAGGRLADEVVLVDGGSRDATAERAAAAGARVVDQATAVPDAGPAGGKGDALWKGLASTSGDLVAFLDADVTDPDERALVALVGPLLADHTLALVKACFERPLREPRRVSAGGGRVTELTARPLLAAFWPELGGVAQPLAGEYAGRRDVLEAVPFPEGYGVEIGVLIDVAALFGVDAIGQVDLGSRSHSHQGLGALGRMAAEIVQVAAARLATSGRARLTSPPARALHQPRRGDDGRLVLDTVQVPRRERPPLAEWRRAGTA